MQIETTNNRKCEEFGIKYNDCECSFRYSNLGDIKHLVVTRIIKRFDEDLKKQFDNT